MIRNHRTVLTGSVALTLLLAVNYAHAHSGPLNEMALEACEAKERSQACQYEGGHDDLYIGTCQFMPKDLMCVRNKPIQKIESKKHESEDGHSHSEKHKQSAEPETKNN